MNKIVPKVILDHISKKEPKKALAVSFHGWPGGGKSYVVDFITNLLYFKGVKSKFVHRRRGIDHYSHDSEKEEYKKDLKKLIETATKACSTSLFIFDDFDTMPDGIADVLIPYLDFDREINGVDFRKNILIFLSNSGGEHINNATYEHLAKGGKREEITSYQMETLLKTLAFNNRGGFRKSEMVSSSFIDFFIPFLPLERKHVKECIKVALQIRGKPVNNETLVDEIANELHYFPKGNKAFSTSGCKLLNKKTASLA